VNIALFGYGTIGSGVFELVNKLDDKFKIKYVFDYEEKRNILGNVLETNLDKILNDEEVDIVIEVLGGVGLADKVIKEALRNGKHVITANKQVTSLNLDEYINLARENDVMFLFEASVGGGIPIIKEVCNCCKYDNINEIYGIMNGTTNYILTQIQANDTNLSDAVLMAQMLGYAERDPSADLLGLDMVAKISILTMLATNKKVDKNLINTMGITNLNKEFLDFVKEEELCLKIIAEAIKIDDFYHIDIIPVILNRDSLLAQTNNAYNSIIVECESNGRLMFNGLGAGKLATASAIISDIFNIYENRNYVNYKCSGNLKIDNNKLLRNYFVLDDNNKVIYIENVTLEEIKKYKFYALDRRD
jgi:homoserine dehydrogenase